MKSMAVFLTFTAATLSAPAPHHLATPYSWSFPYTYPQAYPFTSYAAPTLTVAKSVPVLAPLAYTPAAYAPAYTASQYHSQDELGQASFGYAHPGQSRSEVRDAAGNVVGSYAYINPDGKEVRVNYVAGVNGFQVASNDLPVAPEAQAVELQVAPKPVEDTPEVKAARDEHMAAVAAAKARNLAVEEGSSRRRRQAPEPVDYTPEVRAARDEHFKAVEEAKNRNALQDAVDATKFVYPYAFRYGAPATPYGYPFAYPYAAPFAYAHHLPAVAQTVATPASTFAYRVDV